MKKLNKYELFVANWFLSEFPSNLTFEQLLNRADEEVKNKDEYDDNFLIWYPFEQEESISELMQYMLDELYEKFK